MQFFDKFFRHPPAPGKKPGKGVDILARRLRLTPEALAAIPLDYASIKIPRRSGGPMRQLHVPNPQLKTVQRAILRRVLARPQCHPCATGFRHQHSIVTNAGAHQGMAVIVNLDIKNFFTATAAARVEAFFRELRWDDQAAVLLTRLVTHDNGLPQGAPTSPALSNLVNCVMDARLWGYAQRIPARYTRYADDMTFSMPGDDSKAINELICFVKFVLHDYDYRLHVHKKLHILRPHDRQTVTGLVVNETVNLPRSTRRWLRSVEHHRAIGLPTTLSDEQIAGWKALRDMIDRQSPPASPVAQHPFGWEPPSPSPHYPDDDLALPF